MVQSVASRAKSEMEPVISDRAKVVMRSLSERDLAAVQRVMVGIAADGVTASTLASRRVLLGVGSLGHVYAFRATPALRVIVSRSRDDEIVIEDVVHRDLLDSAPARASGE
jgi:hypothetical protein